MKKLILIFVSIVIFPLNLFPQTMGLFQHSIGSNDDGYVMFAPMSYTKTYLMDKCGKEVHSWTSTYRPGLSAYLQSDGNLLRACNGNNSAFNAGGRGGVIQRYDWNSNLLWSYTISDANQCQHHDARPLENGNVLTIVWVKKTVAEAIAAGRNPATLGTALWTEKIIELHPTGATTADIVWEWNVWDNLIQDFDASKPNYGVVADHPEKINLNYAGTGAASDADWLHINSVDFNPEFNQVMISAHDFSEIWIIDRDLGTNGKLVYRWGNPLVYNRGTSANQKLFSQHNATWIPAGYKNQGKILIFNNGLNRPGGNYSTVDIISSPVDALGNYTLNAGMSFAPDSAFWSYKDSVPSNFFGMNISGVQELNNGNFLVCNGPSGTFFEIDSLKRKVWKYINPVGSAGPQIQGSTPTQNTVFRNSFYRTGYSGLNGHTLIPGNPIELNPLSYTCNLITGIKNEIAVRDFNLYQNYPNPFNPATNIKFDIPNSGNVSLKIYDQLGNEMTSLVDGFKNAGSYNISFNASELPSGVYFYKLNTNGNSNAKKMLLIK